MRQNTIDSTHYLSTFQIVFTFLMWEILHMTDIVLSPDAAIMLNGMLEHMWPHAAGGGGTETLAEPEDFFLIYTICFV